MQKAHYDLDTITAGILRMYAEAPPSAIHENPNVVAAFRRAAPVEVEMTKWFLDSIMTGIDPNDAIEALECIFINLIMNRMRGFASDDDGPHPIFPLLQSIVNGVLSNIRSGDFDNKSEHGVSIMPVTSGTA